jgi:23S rRNA (uridine2552-2'-O)-methyltransferase
LTKKWLRERQNDHYHKLAVEEGYRSRAAYKLFQMDEKYEILKPGDVVLDLGASPGGWMQAARVLVGEKGCVLGIDLREIKSFKEPNVTSIVADVEKIEPADLATRLPRKLDVLISDMSPNVSGVWSLDHIRQLDLARMALRLSTQLLNPGGNLVVKVFQGEFFKIFLDDVRNHFKIVRTVKPKASRSESAEMYLVCIGFRGNEYKMA